MYKPEVNGMCMWVAIPQNLLLLNLNLLLLNLKYALS